MPINGQTRRKGGKVYVYRNGTWHEIGSVSRPSIEKTEPLLGDEG
ncbi:MAG: hypothetical protein ABW328_06220 [Ilumatobacteraceae bacterium]